MRKNSTDLLDDAAAMMIVVLPGFLFIRQQLLPLVGQEFAAMTFATVAAVAAVVAIGLLRNNLFLTVMALIAYDNIMLNAVATKIIHAPVTFYIIGAITGCCLGICPLISSILIRRHGIQPIVANAGTLIVPATIYLITGFGIF